MKNGLLTELAQIKEELDLIKKQSFIRMILEGVDDPGILKAVFLGGGPACFVEGTQIRTAEGYKPIQDIEEGELVYTINETTGEEEIKPVVFTHKYDEHTDDLLELEFEDGTIVRCTENHEFYVDGEWVAAKNLKID